MPFSWKEYADFNIQLDRKRRVYFTPLLFKALQINYTIFLKPRQVFSALAHENVEILFSVTNGRFAVFGGLTAKVLYSIIYKGRESSFV